ncbi:MAG: MBOAT family protein [bacterium]|nr:MBOAT family protein [bacterium]
MLPSISLPLSLIIFAGLGLLGFLLTYLVLSRTSGKKMVLGLLPVFGLIMLLPLLIPYAGGSTFNKLLRLVLFLPLFNFILRSVDLAFQKKYSPEKTISFREYLRHHSLTFESQDRTDPARKPDIKGGICYFFSGIGYILAAGFLILIGTYFRLEEWSYPISVVAKMIYFFLFANAAAEFSYFYTRLAGREITPVFNEPLRSYSVEDFWSNRMNVSVRQYFLRFIFLPLGGPKRQELGIMATFLASGLIHEYQMDVASMNPAGFGYILAFFLIHGVVVVWEHWFKRWLKRNHRAFYDRAARNRVLPYLLIPFFAALITATSAIGLKSFDLIIDFHNIEFVKKLLAVLPLPPFPA